MGEREPFCQACQLPLAMCQHRAASRHALHAATVAEPDWDHIEQLADQAADDSSRPFPARYGGVCREGCGQRWEPGELIRYNEFGDLVHEQCG